MSYSEPDSIGPFASNKAIVEWFLTHSSVVDTWIRFYVTNKSDGKLLILKNSVPEIGLLKRDLQTMVSILFHVGQGKRFSHPQIAELDVRVG